MICRFFVFFCLLGLPFAAKADVIRVIQDDGSVAEIEMSAPEPAPAKHEPAPPPKPDIPKARPVPKPQAQKPQDAVAPELERMPVEALRPELAPKNEPETVSAPKVPALAYDGPPIPQRKPATAKYASPDAYVPSRAEVTPGQSAITKDVALAIAIESGAPPARSVQVLPRNIGGREIFVVRFRTAEGLHDILIDRVNGEIIER